MTVATNASTKENAFVFSFHNYSNEFSFLPLLDLNLNFTEVLSDPEVIVASFVSS